ncbi:PD-(D/E)XK nuclease family protein [Bacillus solitudinis]|uniref:PD-(D/E)XK nuclease family protein n=1 Tax=Bacillus solitudinis TaxID=2014074 RepID=UPI0012FDF059|nr:PD-(D/E)XK nuclease family protein [Bacillus solitudinis]
MKSFICPRCGADLIEDASEDIQETKAGRFVVDAFPAIVCRAECGYMVPVDLTPKVIAQQGEDRLLLLYPNEQGRILELRDSVIWPPLQVDSLLARGYWEEYVGNHNVERLLENARDIHAECSDPPNLFQFATSELSQDAFLCWLMLWGEPRHRSLDRPLHEAAVEFISTIFINHNVPVPLVREIEIKRQFKSLDILAVINNTYAILIEDKTYTKDHSNQLTRYRDAVKKVYPNLIQLPVYYKIADQSHYRPINEAGFLPFKRDMMLCILKAGKERGVENTIYLDYYHHLKKIDDSIVAYRTKPLVDWDDYAWQGFYREIQKELEGDWGYVANPSGGFWGFWWTAKNLQKYYMQLEHKRLCVKVSVEEGEDKKQLRTTTMRDVLQLSEQQNLQLQKPSKMGSGKTMTIAERTDYLQTNVNGTVDIKRTIEELKRY